MAIDTAQKRFSMMNFGRQPILPLFIPDGSVDRYHLLNLYSGIILDLPIPIIKIAIGVWSRINTKGQGALSAIIETGSGILSTITPSQGIYSFIDSRGQSTSSPIDENGQGVESK